MVPQAGLLGSLAGIGMALIGCIPMVEVFGMPLIGLVSLGLILYNLVARVRLPGNFPGVLAAIALLVSPEPLSFLVGVDPETGEVMERGHPLYGRRVGGTVLVFPHGKGSTVGSYVIYALARNGKAPAAMVNAEAEPITVVGAVIAGIPLVDRPGIPLAHLRDGVMAGVDGDSGELSYEGELEGD